MIGSITFHARIMILLNLLYLYEVNYVVIIYLLIKYIHPFYEDNYFSGYCFLDLSNKFIMMINKSL